MTPETGDGTGTEVLSVSISAKTSSSAMESPTAFSQTMSPSVMDSAKAGQVTTLTSSHRVALVRRPRWSNRGVGTDPFLRELTP